jgi:hypothetical protein
MHRFERASALGLTLVVCAGPVACCGDGDFEAKVLGSPGGTLVSADGRMRVEFPPGALTEDTEVSIERIDNQAPHGQGDAYRIDPRTSPWRSRCGSSSTRARSRRSPSAWPGTTRTAGLPPSTRWSTAPPPPSP